MPVRSMLVLVSVLPSSPCTGRCSHPFVLPTCISTEPILKVQVSTQRTSGQNDRHQSRLASRCTEDGSSARRQPGWDWTERGVI